MFLMYKSGWFVAGGANEDDNDRIDNEIDGKNDAWIFNFSFTCNKIFIICDILEAILSHVINIL